MIDRLDGMGQVAHEEAIGEFAAMENLAAGRPPSTAPILDYKMIDDDFMLAPVVAHYLLDTEEGRGRAAEFLARTTPAGETYATVVARNFAFVVASAAAYTHSERAVDLVALRKGSGVAILLCPVPSRLMRTTISVSAVFRSNEPMRSAI